MPVARTRDERLQVVSFSFSTSSPMLLRQVTAGQLIETAQVVIQEAFNDPSATVRFGTTASPGAIIGPTDTRPSVLGQYENDEVFNVVVPDNLILTITPGTSTQGSGLLLYRVKE